MFNQGYVQKQKNKHSSKLDFIVNFELSHLPKTSICLFIDNCQWSKLIPRRVLYIVEKFIKQFEKD